MPEGKFRVRKERFFLKKLTLLKEENKNFKYKNNQLHETLKIQNK